MAATSFEVDEWIMGWFHFQYPLLCFSWMELRRKKIIVYLLGRREEGETLKDSILFSIKPCEGKESPINTTNLCGVTSGSVEANLMSETGWKIICNYFLRFLSYVDLPCSSTVEA